MRIHLLPTDVLFEAGKAAKLSSAGAQLGVFAYDAPPDPGWGSPSPHSPLDAFGSSISATSAPRFLPPCKFLAGSATTHCAPPVKKFWLRHWPYECTMDIELWTELLADSPGTYTYSVTVQPHLFFEGG